MATLTSPKHSWHALWSGVRVSSCFIRQDKRKHKQLLVSRFWCRFDNECFLRADVGMETSNLKLLIIINISEMIFWTYLSCTCVTQGGRMYANVGPLFAQCRLAGQFRPKVVKFNMLHFTAWQLLAYCWTAPRNRPSLFVHFPVQLVNCQVVGKSIQTNFKLHKNHSAEQSKFPITKCLLP